MKKIPCNYSECSGRRLHYTIQDENRPHCLVEVADDYEGLAFCSITCACVAGYFHVTKGWLKDPKEG